MGLHNQPMEYLLVLVTILLGLVLLLLFTRKTSHPSTESQKKEGDSSLPKPKPTIVMKEGYPHISYHRYKCTLEQLKQRSMEFYRLMNERRSIRFFKDTPVPF